MLLIIKVLIGTILFLWASPLLLEVFFYYTRKKKLPDIPIKDIPIPRQETEPQTTSRIYDGFEWDLVQNAERPAVKTSSTSPIKLEINED